ncbi:MAG: helix-turn-helix domain-containing protein [Clostridia bacterium]|nr:helix-turn-helix domain-containing protein [Clostridia bacterium]
MSYVRIPLSCLFDSLIWGKECFHMPRMHVSRKTTDHIFYFIAEGEMTLLINGVETVLKPRDVIFFPKGSTQAPTKSTFCTYFFLHINGDAPLSFLDEKVAKAQAALQKEAFTKRNAFLPILYLPQKTSIEDNVLWKGLLDFFSHCRTSIVCRSVEERLEHFYTLSKALLSIQEYILTDKDTQAAISSPRNKALVKGIKQYVEGNYTQSFDSYTLEKVFFLTFNHLNRVFRRATGQTIFAYRNTLRLDEAKNLLLLSEASLSEIATTVGFESEGYFCRIFKKYEGIAPKTYRKIHR